MINFLLLTALAVTLFRVPLKGDFVTAATGALLYVACSTGIGLLVSTLTRTQVAALFATAVLTLVPAGNFCGLTDPVSSLEGFGRLVGEHLPDQPITSRSPAGPSTRRWVLPACTARSSPC